MSLWKHLLPAALSIAVLTPSAHAQTDAARPAASPAVARLPEKDSDLPGAGPFRRADWFRQVWAAQRTKFARRSEKEHGAVVFLGDSITQGWGDTLGGSFGGMKTANRGISGDTTRGVLYRLNEDVLALDPRAVVLLIGTNDLEENADPETIAGNVQLLLAAFREHNANMPVLLCEVFPSSASKKRPAEKIKKVNALYAGLAKNFPQVTMLVTWSLFANEAGDAKAEEFPDLLHPNQAGYAKWAAVLRPALVTLHLLDVPGAFQPEPGFVSLFNGRDLTGWGYRTNQFDGKKASPEGRYTAQDGVLTVHPQGPGPRIAQIWTTREFPRDFLLKLEFRAGVNADSGIFLRKPQLQCRDYLVAGPYKTLKNYRPQDWNEIVVAVTNGVAHCACNGEVLEPALPLPATGPIGLEGDRGQMEYRRIRLKEKPGAD